MIFILEDFIIKFRDFIGFEKNISKKTSKSIMKYRYFLMNFNFLFKFNKFYKKSLIVKDQHMATTTEKKEPLRIAFLHPDLGIGGAE